MRLAREHREGRGHVASLMALVYVGLGVLGACLALLFGQKPTTREPWLPTSGTEAVVASLCLGLAGAGLAVLLTRGLVRRAAWARALHGKLRPFVRHSDGTTLLFIALASGIGEELFFRGFLSATVGVWLSSLAFGALHQVRGAGRWGWAASAFVMGLFLALVYALTGQLIGCIAAHVLVNALNLRYVRDNDPDPKPRKLGGLLGVHPASVTRPAQSGTRPRA